MSAIGFVISQFVCLHLAKRPFQTLKEPSSYGLEHTENFYLDVGEDGEGSGQTQIGAWFVHPTSTSTPQQPQEEVSASCDANTIQGCSRDGLGPRQYVVGKDEVVVLYLHGNAETRSQRHRRELYAILQGLRYHVLAIDYRGYADSTFLWRPNEETMSHDAMVAYTWLVEKTHPDAKIVVWGHSLGTGVTAKLGTMINEKRLVRPDLYILEAPFSSMLEEIHSFKSFYFLPLDFDGYLKEYKLEFDTMKHLPTLKEPIFIFHAEDDEVIPLELAQRLYDASKDHCNVTFRSFEGSLGLGHNNLHKHADFAKIIQSFIEKVEKQKQ